MSNQANISSKAPIENTENPENPIKVSVVIPVFNRKERLKVVLNSLLEQTFKESYEILLVDDGSTDGSCDNLTDSRIRVIKQKNQGAACARHKGAVEAYGEFVVFHDSDDIATPEKIAVLVEALENNPECKLAFAITEEPKANWQLPEWAQTKAPYVVFNNPLEHYFNFSFPLASAMNLAMKKQHAILASEKSHFYKAANDYQLQFKAAFLGAVVAVPKITNHYYIGTEESITSKFGSYKQAMFALFSLIENFTQQANSDATYLLSLQERVENEAPNALLYLLKNKNFTPYFWPLIKITFKYGRISKLPKQFYWAWLRLKE